jgi:hypothetical protein
VRAQQVEGTAGRAARPWACCLSLRQWQRQPAVPVQGQASCGGGGEAWAEQQHLYQQWP